MTNSNKPHMTLPSGDVIHEGGYGVLAGGRKVGPITRRYDMPIEGSYAFEAPRGQLGEYVPAWYSDGRFYSKAGSGRDIIAAWVDVTKPAKDPNRPRPAHKLNLQKGDVVRRAGWKDGSDDDYIGLEIKVGGNYHFDKWLQEQIDAPYPKGQRPLFVVVSRAKPTLPAYARNRLAFAENAMLEDGMTPGQIRDHMRRYADVIDGQICGMERDA